MIDVDKIVKKEAQDFVEHTIKNGYSLSKLNSEISNKLYDFSNDRDKHKFLVFARQQLDTQKMFHDLKCTKENCRFDESHHLKIYAIEQEIERIYMYLEKEEPVDKFSAFEQVSIISKIDEIIQHFSNRSDKIDAGLEILFNELQDLKDCLNLGKKTFGQVLVGKVMEMVASSIIDKTAGNEIYMSLMQGIKDVKGFLK